MHNYVFPASYEPWLAPRFQAAPEETVATCSTCNMAKPACDRPGPTRDPGPFKADLKCCTYFPYLPNFSLGLFTDLELKKVETQGVLLPVGLYPSVEYQRRQLRLSADGESAGKFGNDPDLLCPFYDQSANVCGRWSQRPGVCTSYFCQSSFGAEGLLFWKDVESYLNHFEWELARRLFSDLGLTDNELTYGRAAISVETEDDERPFFIEAAWGHHLKDKASFYRQSRALALQYSQEQIGALLGLDFLRLEQSLNQRVKDFTSC